MTIFVTEPVRDIRTGQITGTITVEVNTPEEAAALDAQAAAVVANEQTLRDRADQALAGNAAYLGLASPTNAQAVAQVAALTRQQNAVIRLILRKLDTTVGTQSAGGK
jgi:hypothetical protein